MTLSAAFLIFLFGVLVGMRLPGPLARLRAAWRRRRYQPALFKPYVPPAAPGAVPPQDRMP